MGAADSSVTYVSDHAMQLLPLRFSHSSLCIDTNGEQHQLPAEEQLACSNYERCKMSVWTSHSGYLIHGCSKSGPSWENVDDSKRIQGKVCCF